MTYEDLATFLFTVYIGTWAHESAHYIAGWPWTNRQRMVYWYKIIPCRVEWNDTDIPMWAYRVAGAAPLVWLIPGFFIMYYEIQPLAASGHFFDAFTRLPLIAAGIPSRTDLQSVFATEDWMDAANE